MAISIYITNKIVGKSILYSKINKGGNEVPVALYEMLITNKSGTAKKSKVTRDSLKSVFSRNTKDRYEVNGECPPNKTSAPYEGKIRFDGGKGFRIELYENGIDGNKKNSHYLLRGIGKVKRTHIQIHIGPGHSEGCLLLADNERGRDKFQKVIEELINEDVRNGVKRADTFEIHVEER